MPGLGAYQPAVLFLHHLDDLVAVARLLGDQRQRNQPQVALRQHPPGADHVVAAHAVTAATAEPWRWRRPAVPAPADLPPQCLS